MKVAGWAEAHYIDLMPHNPLGPICTAATIHLGAAAPNFAWMETFEPPVSTFPPDPAMDELFPVRPKLDGAGFPILDTPGLGVEFNEEMAAKQEWRFAEQERLRRRDGSHTNA